MANNITIDSTESNSIFLFRDSLCKIITPILKSERSIVFLCIGSDRSTGDSLGPIVGDKLQTLLKNKINVFGTLAQPVHAKNLCDTLEIINNTISNPFIIAIDACLGSIQNVGKIFIECKPLHPGSAMNKDLPQVGNLSITGIVNISGAMEFMVLQNTRLHTVMQLANVISTGTYHSILKILGNQKLNNPKTSNIIGMNIL